MDYWARQLLHVANSRQRTTGSYGFHAQAHTAAGRIVQCEHAHRTMTAAQTCSRSGAFQSYVRSIETADAAEAARRAAAHAARQQRQAAVTAARQAKREARTPAEKQHATSQIRRAGGLTPRGFLRGLLGVLIFAGIITGIVFIVIAAVKSDKPGPAPAVPSWVHPGGTTDADWRAMAEDLTGYDATAPANDIPPAWCLQLSNDANTAVTDITSYNSSAGTGPYGTRFAGLPDSVLQTITSDASSVLTSTSPGACGKLASDVLAAMETAAQWTPSAG
jgi:hypothetical protein